MDVDKLGNRKYTRGTSISTQYPDGEGPDDVTKFSRVKAKSSLKCTDVVEALELKIC